MIKISASILSADFSILKEEIIALEKASVDYLHFDVMDGNFVPNITFGHKLVKDLRKWTSIPFDVHLMVNEPERHIDNFIEAGGDIITIHLESSTHIYKNIMHIKNAGKKVGISIVPSTPADHLAMILEEVDLVLVMTVSPGFGGQEFINSQLKKIRQIRSMIDSLDKDIMLSVDGGVNAATASSVCDAGANLLVAGSYIFQNGEYSKQVSCLKSL